MSRWSWWMVAGAWAGLLAGDVRAGEACNAVVWVSSSSGLVVPSGDTDFTIYAEARAADVTLAGIHPFALTTDDTGRVTVTEPFPYKVESVEDDEKTVEGEIRLREAWVDLDIDSDNTSAPPAYRPQRTAREDADEDDPALPGRILVCAVGDVDADGVPDFADHDAAAALPVMTLDVSRLGGALVDQQALVRFQYNASRPADVGVRTVTRGGQSRLIHSSPEDGGVRIWTVDGTAGRNPASVLDGGHWVPADTDLPLEQLFPDGARLADLYVEAVGEGPQRIEVSVQPRAGSDWWSDAVRVTALHLELLPDRTQDRQIDGLDRDEAVWRPVYRYWTNIDQDAFKYPLDSNTRYRADGDYLAPDTINVNAENRTVDGMRDLLDFFPVRVDLGDTLRVLADLKVEIRFQQEDNAVNMMAAAHAPDAVSRILTDHAYAATYEEAVVLRGGSRRMLLDEEMLAAFQTGPAILYFEGSKNTEKPLVMEIRKPKNGALLAQVQLPLRLSCTMDMMRWIDLQLPGGTVRDDMASDDPPNWPDAEANRNHIVFLHGFLEDNKSVPGHASAMFKRLFWAGSRAAFTGVRWTADIVVPRSIPVNLRPRFMGYQHSLTNAIRTGVLLRYQLPPKAEGGKTILMAHSLGNIVASECMKGLAAGRVDDYVLLNAAVAAEAYMPRDVFTADNTETTIDMVHPSWHQYSYRLRCSEWYRLFAPPEVPDKRPRDLRHELTWRGYFVDVPGKTRMWNYYSSGENVLQVAEPTFGIFTVAWRNVLDYFGCDAETGRLSWQSQEIGKGQGLGMDNLTRIVAGFGGWAFSDSPNYYKDGKLLVPNEAKDLSDAVLQPTPFFLTRGRGEPERLSYLFKGASDAGIYDSNKVVDKHYHLLLARMIPATSHPVGSGGVGVRADDEGVTVMKPGEIWQSDMQQIATTFDKEWPRQKHAEWWHRDHRRIAYQFVYKVFNSMVENAELGEMK